MKTGGWTRLWIVLVSIYGILVVIIAYDVRPKLSSIEYRWVNEGSRLVSEIISENENISASTYEIKEAFFKDKTSEETISWFNKVVDSPTEKQKRFSSSLAPINEKYKKELAGFSGEKIKHYFASFLWWLIPSVGLYLFGWSVGWVIRGFKKQN